MKKGITTFAALIFALTLCACGGTPTKKVARQIPEGAKYFTDGNITVYHPYPADGFANENQFVVTSNMRVLKITRDQKDADYKKLKKADLEKQFKDAGIEAVVNEFTLYYVDKLPVLFYQVDFFAVLVLGDYPCYRAYTSSGGYTYEIELRLISLDLKNDETLNEALTIVKSIGVNTSGQ